MIFLLKPRVLDYKWPVRPSEESSDFPPRGISVASKPHWTSQFIRFRFVAFLVILAVFAWILFPRKESAPELRKDETEQQSRALFDSMKIWRALDQFRKRHGTDSAPYPVDIHQLDKLGITEDIGALLALKRQFAGDWLYFPKAEPAKLNSALLISPPLVEKSRRSEIKQRLVMSVNGGIQLLSPNEAQKWIDASTVPPVRIPSPVR